MASGVNLTMVKNVGWNGFGGLTHYVAGYVVALNINLLARQIFDYTQRPSLADTVRCTAFASGLGVSLYFHQQIPLIHFTADQALHFVALSIGLKTVASFIGDYWRDKPNPKLTTILRVTHWGAIFGCAGAMTGHFKAPTLTAFGTLGAFIGAMQDSELKAKTNP